MADNEISLDDVFTECVQRSGGTSRTDAVVLALHSCLIADGFHLIAIGDEGFETKTSSSYTVSLSDSSNPILPNRWNSSQEVYAFQYKPAALTSDNVCLVKALPIGDQIAVNVLCSNDPSNIITVLLPLDQYTTAVDNGLVTMATYKNTLKLFTTINRDINSRVKQRFTSSKSTCKETSSKATPTEPPRHDPLRVGEPRRPHPFSGGDPFAYGSGDLSPFGGPGGMIMDPMRQGGIRGGPLLGPRPPGFHPPGARYDPVSPFGPTVPRPPNRGGGRMYGPDPDHLPPPGSDDWFS